MSIIFRTVSLSVAGFFISLLFATTVSAQASFSLSPSHVVVSEGEMLAVVVHIDTMGVETVGADVTVQFDTQKLELDSIEPGAAYPNYSRAIIDNKVGTGSIGGVVEPTTTFQGQGEFATLMFTAQKGGEAEIMVDFTPGDRNDSNIATVDGNDALVAADAVSIQVKGSANFFDKIIEFFQSLFGGKKGGS